MQLPKLAEPKIDSIFQLVKKASDLREGGRWSPELVWQRTFNRWRLHHWFICISFQEFYSCSKPLASGHWCFLFRYRSQNTFRFWEHFYIHCLIICDVRLLVLGYGRCFSDQKHAHVPLFLTLISGSGPLNLVQLSVGYPSHPYLQKLSRKSPARLCHGWEFWL